MISTLAPSKASDKKGNKICKVPPVHYSDMMFMGLVNQFFSLGGRNLIMTQLKKEKKKSEDFEEHKLKCTHAHALSHIHA